MAAKRGHTVGAIMLAKSGDVAVFGPLSDPRLGAMVLDRRWLSDLKRRRTSTLTLDDATYAVLCMPTEAGDLLVFSDGVPDPVLQFLGSVDFAYEVFDYLVSEPSNAMTVIDRDGQLVYMSQHHEEMFSNSPQTDIGRPVRDVIENTQLDRVIGTGKEEFGDLQHVNGAPRVVHRSPIFREGRVIGAVGRVLVDAPDTIDALTHRISELEKEVTHLRAAQSQSLTGRLGPMDIVGDSAAIRAVRADISKLAPLDLSVLVHGESGAGKLTVARALHGQGPRRQGPFVSVSLSTLDELLHSVEFFGHVPGAIPGADRLGAEGKLEKAHTGVLYIDELTALSREMQARLLEVLRHRECHRIGSNQVREIDVRVVVGTSRDPNELSELEGMNSELLNFLSPTQIAVPPLREHPEDIPALARAFLEELAERTHNVAPGLSDDAIDFLEGQSWPGNVRQLRAEVEAAFFACDGDVLHRTDFMPRRGRMRPGKPSKATSSKGLHAAMDALGMDLILEALERCGGNKKKAAAQLGISRSYLYKRLAEAQI